MTFPYKRNPLDALKLYREGKLPATSHRRYAERLTIADLTKPARPFFSSIDSKDDEYVSAFRMLFFSGLNSFNLKELEKTFQFHAGKNLGYELFDKGVVRSLNDIFNMFYRYKIGLVDVMKKTDDLLLIDVYECILCSGLPITGKPTCYFEAGMLSGILDKLFGRNEVRELKCWTLGDFVCRFKIRFI